MDRSNHQHWEQLASVHGLGNDRYYDLDALIAGATLMGDEECAALLVATNGAGVAGLDVMHLQCHIGCDSITMARAEGRVTGVDFSATALARLEQLAERCGVHVRTLEADSRDLPRELDDSFDIVYATIGVLCWIDDLAAWMNSVSRVLRRAGRLVLVELHPLFTMIDTIDPLVVDFPYAFDGPHVFTGTGSYANRDADVAWTTTQYAHGLAEIVMAAQREGLGVIHLEEHLSMAFDPRGMDPPTEADGRFRLRLGRGSPDPGSDEPGSPLPVLFTLVAEKR